MDNTTLEQYKSYIADVGNVGNRYATANGFYLSVVSALLGVLAFVGADKALNPIHAIIVTGVPLFGCVACWIWYKTIVFYGQLFRSKFDVLRAMESDSLSYDCYAREQKILMERKVEWLTQNERKVPLMLGILFAVIAVASLLAALR